MASEAFVRKHHLENQAVEIVAQEMVTDFSSTFEENSCIKMVRNCVRGTMNKYYVFTDKVLNENNLLEQ